MAPFRLGHRWNDHSVCLQFRDKNRAHHLYSLKFTNVHFGQNCTNASKYLRCTLKCCVCLAQRKVIDRSLQKEHALTDAATTETREAILCLNIASHLTLRSNGIARVNSRNPTARFRSYWTVFCRLQKLRGAKLFLCLVKPQAIHPRRIMHALHLCLRVTEFEFRPANLAEVFRGFP